MKRNGKVVFAHRDGTGAGKGDSPRNNQSPEFRANYDSLDWGNAPDCPGCGRCLCTCK